MYDVIYWNFFFIPLLVMIEKKKRIGPLVLKRCDLRHNYLAYIETLIIPCHVWNLMLWQSGYIIFLHHSRLICTTRDIQLLKKRLSTTFLSFLLLSAVMDRWWWPTNEWMEQKHIKIKEEFIVKIFFAGRSISIPLHLLL